MPLGEDSSTGLIDDEGRLFGYVNIVDVIVVLLVVAVGVAGFALLFGSSSPASGNAWTHATLDLGVQSPNVADAISEGDTYEPRGDSNLTVTDVYRVPEGAGQRTVVRVNLTGPLTESGLRYDGTPPRLGRNLTVSTDRYNASGDITAVGADDTLALEERPVVLETTLPSYRAEEFVADQQIQLGDRTIATVEEVTRYDEGSDRTRLYLQASLQTYTSEGLTRFGGTIVQEGETVRLPGDDSLVAMEITRAGAGFERTETTVLATETVTAAEADEIDDGDTYLVGEQTAATIEEVRFYDTDDPDRKEMYATVTLGTLTLGERPQFGSTIVRQGATVPFETEEYDLELSVDRVDSGLERSTTRALLSDTVSADEASAIAENDTYLVGGQTVATIESVAVYDTADPDQKDVYANATLQTLAIGERPQLGSTTVRQGATVPFVTNDYELDARIERLETGLERASTTVLVTDTLDVEDAAAIEEGDQYVVAGHPVATVESVDVYGTGDPDRREVYVGLSLSTLEYGELPRFGSTLIQRGATVPFETETYELAGEIRRIGTTDQPGTPTTGTVTLEIDNVEPSLADSIEPGMAEQSGDRIVAQITDVTRENATIVLTSDDGQIYQREHPINQDVTVTADLALRQTDAGIRFKGQLLQRGSTVRLDLGSVTISGEVVGPIQTG